MTSIYGSQNIEIRFLSPIVELDRLLIDDSGHELVRFGKVPDIKLKQELSQNISYISLSFFENAYGFRAGDLKIFLVTEGKWLLFLVVLLGAYLILVTFSFGFLIRRYALREEKLRTSMTFEKMRLEKEYNERVAFISKSIAHDIRSPLSILNAISVKIKSSSPMEGQLLKEVSTRIIQIADGFLDISREIKIENPERRDTEAMPSVAMTSQDVISLCESAISEKKIELGNSNIRLQFYNEVINPFSVICDANDLSRILSNLLNNSIEAISQSGFVTLSLTESEQGILIEIRDSGKGMSKELISKVMQGPVSQGKVRGNGLGLWPAIQKTQEWGGSLEIKSEHGTIISIRMKRKNDSQGPFAEEVRSDLPLNLEDK